MDADKQDILGRFELQSSDGVHCTQVIIYNPDDLQYWKAESKRTGHLIGFDHHTPAGAIFGNAIAFDVYQIFPPEQADKFQGIKLIE